MGKWLQILIPVGLGWGAFELLQPHHWSSIRQGLMFALSMLGAATLVRLARGMPVSDIEYFEVEEVRKFSAAVEQVYRALIVLFIVIVLSIMGLVFIEVVLSGIADIQIFELETKVIFQQLATASLVFIVAFALARTISLIAGDYDLIKLQAKHLTRAVERRHASESLSNLDEADASKPYRQRPGYGKLVQ